MESAATPLHQLTVHSAGDHAVAVRSGSTRCLGGADCGLYITQGCSWCSLFRRLAVLGIEPERQREFPAASVGGRHGIEERVAHVVAPSSRNAAIVWPPRLITSSRNWAGWRPEARIISPDSADRGLDQKFASKINWAAFLHRCLGHHFDQEVEVGDPAAGDPRHGVEVVLGCFEPTFPLR